MHLDTVLRKTDRARDLLRQQDALPRAQRLFLALLDGATPLRALHDPARQLGIDATALARLANAGLIEWSRSDEIVLRGGPAQPVPARHPNVTLS